jgi:Ca-activated chloride channel family protein
MLQDFHFLTPLWFLALLPLAVLLWAAARAGSGVNAWRKVVDERLLAALLVGDASGARRWWPMWLLAAGWSIAVIALANPTFERQQIPAFRSDAARVIALDLSRSMLADDLTPTRLDRARYKLADIVRRTADGQVALVAFAGDAFAVVPLTDDGQTLLAMLDALSPEVMPVQGSRPDLAIALGAELLQQAGARAGEVVLLTDDAGGERALAAAQRLRAAGHRLAVIGVGTPEGAAVPGVQTSRGDVVARLDVQALRALAASGGGDYASLSTGDADLEQVLREPVRSALSATDPMLTESWKELGPWIALALLPLAALAFRRGWLLAVACVAVNLSLLAPRPALALGWDDLWQRRDQQAAAALDAGDYQRARELAADPARTGTASYRLGDYDAAAEAFAAGDDAEHHYNRANALVRAGRLEDAIAAYDEALARDPAHGDAAHNKEQVERLLRQQQAQQPSGQDQQDGEQGGEGQSGEEQPGQDQSGQDQSGRDQSGSGESDPKASDPDDSDQDRSGQDGAEQAHSGEQDSSASSETASDQQRQGGAGEQADPGAAADAAPDSDETSAGDDARTEQAAADYRAEAAAEPTPESGPEPGPEPEPEPAGRQGAGQEGDAEQPDGSLHAAGDEPTPEELEARQAADQWLRRIPDDPAGLLRRKFLYQYRARAGENGDMSANNPW